MTYATHSIVASATPAVSLLTALDADILAVTGWTKVETLLVSGTMTWNVYKSAAANNAQGADFYVALGYVTATGTSLLMTVFEQWNTGSDQATNFAPNASSTPSATYANPASASALPSTGTGMLYLQTDGAIVTTGFTAGCDVSANRIAFWILSSTNSWGFYMGLYEAFNNATDDPFPLCCIRLGPSPTGTSAVTVGVTTNGGFATREPKQTAASANNFSAGTVYSTGSWTPVLQNANEGYSGKPLVARQIVYGRASASFLRGLLRDLYNVGTLLSNNGDAVQFTLNGVTFDAYRAGLNGNYAVYIAKT